MAAKREKLASKQPKAIHITGFLNRVKALTAKSPDSSLLFLLGSGASRQSGIKTGGEMVADWLDMLRQEDPEHERVDAEKWADPERLGIPHFDTRDPAACYPDIFTQAYGGRRKEGFDYLEGEISGKAPSFGYSVLAQILAVTKHKVIVTTNFDNLVIDALSIYTTATPLVCGHESLAGFIRHRPTRPQIVKVHRDLFYAPRNTTDELGPLPTEFANALRDLFRAHIPVVIGYGANDGSLMGVLNDLNAGELPQGLYWCYWNGGNKPRQEILDLVAKHDGWLVGIEGFDELMLRFQDALGLTPLDDFLKERGDERAERYKERRDTLGSVLRAASAASEPSSTAGAQSAEALQALQSVMARKQSQRTAQEWDSLAKLEPDSTKRAEIYEEGLRALPDSAWMAEYAAYYFSKSQATEQRAEDLHKRAVELAGSEPWILGNYAVFLKNVRKDYDAAETLYKRALAINPNRARGLGNYAIFLWQIRKDYDTAEGLYKRSLETTPSRAILNSYADFLTTIRKDYDAAEAIYKRALEMEPNNAITLGNYARALLASAQTEPGLAILDKALAMLDARSPSPVNLECWMYAYCFKPSDQQPAALARLKSLVVETELRTGAWDFSGVIEQATRQGHAESDWLPKLALVLSGDKSPASLKEWRAWQSA